MFNRKILVSVILLLIAIYNPLPSTDVQQAKNMLKSWRLSVPIPNTRSFNLLAIAQIVPTVDLTIILTEVDGDSTKYYLILGENNGVPDLTSSKINEITFFPCCRPILYVCTLIYSNTCRNPNLQNMRWWYNVFRHIIEAVYASYYSSLRNYPIDFAMH